MTAAPFLLDRPDVEKIFAPDAVARARKLNAAFTGGVGAYTDSRCVWGGWVGGGAG